MLIKTKGGRASAVLGLEAANEDMVGLEKSLHAYVKA